MKLGKLSKNNHGAISTYVMLLFGMIIILYMFGYTSMWTQYSNNAEISGTGVEGDDQHQTDESTSIFDVSNPLNMGITLLTIMTSSIYATLVSGATILGTFVLIWWFRDNPAIWSFIIPIILLLILNIFIFPISELGSDMATLDAVFTKPAEFSFTIILLGFFNLFYILSVIEFVRGGNT